MGSTQDAEQLPELIAPAAPSANSFELRLARTEVSRHMTEILQLFRPGAMITVLVRNPDGERVEGAYDFIMTNDEPGPVARMIARRWSGGARR